jgi:hypothetical protein
MIRNDWFFCRKSSERFKVNKIQSLERKLDDMEESKIIVDNFTDNSLESDYQRNWDILSHSKSQDLNETEM